MPIDTAKQVIPELKTAGRVDRAYLGDRAAATALKASTCSSTARCRAGTPGGRPQAGIRGGDHEALDELDGSASSSAATSSSSIDGQGGPHDATTSHAAVVEPQAGRRRSRVELLRGGKRETVERHSSASARATVAGRVAARLRLRWARARRRASRSAASPASRTPSWRVELGAWAVGLHPAGRGSPRALRPGRGGRDRRRAAPPRRAGGVFVNATLDEVAREADADRPTHVQLHGDEGPAFCAEVARRTGARSSRPRACAAARRRPRRSSASTPTSTCSTPPRPAARRHAARPSTGSSLARRRSQIAAGPLRRARRPTTSPRRSPPCDPFAVDSARGTEAEPGVKDPAKVAALPGGRRARRGRGRMSAPRRAPLRPLRRPVRPRDADARAGRARGGVGRRRATTRLPAPSSTRLLRDYAGRPTPLYDARRLSEAAGRPVWLKREDLQPHRRAQDQQRARPGAAGPAHGQAAHHRRDRRGPARRRHRDRVRAARPRVRRLHGRRGHAPPAAQRPAHGAARRDASSRSRPGRARSRRRSPRRSATGSPTSATRTTSSARPSARRRSRRSCATSSA